MYLMPLRSRPDVYLCELIPILNSVKLYGIAKDVGLHSIYYLVKGGVLNEL